MAPLKGEADGESENSEKLVVAQDQIVSLKTALETKVLEETKGAKSVKETKVMAQLEKETDKGRRLGLGVQNSEDANEEIKKELAAAEAKNDELKEDINAKEEPEYNFRIKVAETNARGEEEKDILEDKLKAEAEAAEKKVEVSGIEEETCTDLAEEKVKPMKERVNIMNKNKKRRRIESKDDAIGNEDMDC